MKRVNCFRMVVLTTILVQIVLLIRFDKVYAKVPSYSFRLIETIEKDTTGKGVNDKIKWRQQ